jgi:hypothetical protein
MMISPFGIHTRTRGACKPRGKARNARHQGIAQFVCQLWRDTAYCCTVMYAGLMGAVGWACIGGIARSKRPATSFVAPAPGDDLVASRITTALPALRRGESTYEAGEKEKYQASSVSGTHCPVTRQVVLCLRLTIRARQVCAPSLQLVSRSRLDR